MEENRSHWFNTEIREGKTYVFDPLRNRFVLLTPEEKVRQGVLRYLVEQKGVPRGLLAVEYSIKVNGLDKRCDAVVFSKDGKPLMIVECKAPDVLLTPNTLAQALRYYSALYPRFLLLSNGSVTNCFQVKKGSLRVMDFVPNYAEMGDNEVEI